LAEAVAAHAGAAGMIVITADDVSLAMLAAADLAGGSLRVRTLLGGNAAWRAAGTSSAAGKVAANEGSRTGSLLQPAKLTQASNSSLRNGKQSQPLRSGRWASVFWR
jgi:hypothetical protein